MVDPRRGGSRCFGLGVIGNAKSSGFNHGNIISAITHGQAFVRRKAFDCARLFQDLLLGGRAHNVAFNTACQHAILNAQDIGNGLIKPNFSRHRLCKAGEPA